MALVSICIPVYKNAGIFNKVLESVKQQTFQDYEVIVSDDSPDNSVKEVVERSDFAQPFFYFQNKPALGSPANWNAAVSKSSGKYIKIIHHDDWFTQAESLSAFVSMMEADSQPDFAFSATKIISASNEIRLHQPADQFALAIQKDPRVLFNGNFIGGPSATIYKKSVLESFDENLQWLVDIDFYIRVLFHNRHFSYTNEPLITAYEAPGRITDTCSNNKQVDVFEHFYVYNKLNRLGKSAVSAGNMWVLGTVCLRYNIQSIAEIRSLGYHDRVPFFINGLLFFNKGPKFLLKIYLRVFRIFFRLPKG